jgi:hypothetical protein
MGLAQNLEGFNGEAEPRLTSGGEAATLPTKELFVQSFSLAPRSQVPPAIAGG